MLVCVVYFNIPTDLHAATICPTSKQDYRKIFGCAWTGVKINISWGPYTYVYVWTGVKIIYTRGWGSYTYMLIPS